MGDLGTSYVAAWVGDVITISRGQRFGCALACAVAPPGCCSRSV
jgi:hypothetical protein